MFFHWYYHSFTGINVLSPVLLFFHWYYHSFTGINVLSLVLLFIVFLQICLIFFGLIFKCHINSFSDGILEPGVKMFKVQILVLEDPLVFFTMRE
jgi:hypothetical protein